MSCICFQGPYQILHPLVDPDGPFLIPGVRGFIDGIEQTKRENELKRLQAERRAQFKKVNDGLKAYGL